MTAPSPFNAWKSAQSKATFSDPSEFAIRASKFERRIRIRNWLEYGTAVFVTVLFGGTTIGALIKGELLIALSTLAIVIGVFVSMRGLKQRGSNLKRRPEDNCLQHLRRQYNHQYEALRDVPRWYIGPFVPGIVLFYVAVTAGVAEVIGWANALAGIAGPASITLGLFALVAGANWLAARMLKKKVDELDALA